MKNLIKFENFSVEENKMRSREEMTHILCNNGYSVEECNEMTYAEMCNACDGCDNIEMAQTYEARKATKTTKTTKTTKKDATKHTVTKNVTKKVAQGKLKNGNKLTDPEIAAMSGNRKKITKGDFIEIAKFNAEMLKESQPATKKPTAKKK